MLIMSVLVLFFLFKQMTAYEMRISDWSSDVCSSDLRQGLCREIFPARNQGGDGHTRQECARGARHAHHQPDVDAARNEGEGEEEARQFHDQDRLPRPLEGL